ncbi:MAG TPA: NADH-quinone oxidoreductase subunit N [Gemmatimonadaceae bacterium]|nr:NADH-quinone oxidoreductase subunit N [Gemmatimonadaceae bacterium]
MHFDLSVPSQLTAALLPDLIVMGGAMVLLLIGAWRRESAARQKAVGIGAILVCIAAAVATVWMWRSGATANDGVIAVDAFRWASDLIVLLATVLAILLALDYNDREQLIAPESHVLVLLASSGMMLLTAARDLMIVFLGIELMSIAVYVLAGLNRRSSRAAEAALKYFLLGAFSTGFLLYGIALLYGATGSTEIGAIGERLDGSALGQSPMLLIGMGLLLVGFGFKIAAAPFHMWTPDVYEGAPTPYTAYMASAVKVAGFAAFLRVWLEAFPATAWEGTNAAWYTALAGLAIVTMIVGNIVALAQKNIKRLLAYSSIAHAGYILVALVVGTSAGASAFIFYLIAYTLATMGAFAVIIALGESGERNLDVADYSGLWTVRPGLAAAMAVFMLAMLGFPIAGGMGFFAKWYVLDAALDAPRPQVALAVLVVLTSVISAGYYLYVVMVMFMRPRPADAPAPARVPRLTAAVIAISAVGILYFGIFPGWAIHLARLSAPATATAPAAGPPLSVAPAR